MTTVFHATSSAAQAKVLDLKEIFAHKLPSDVVDHIAVLLPQSHLLLCAAAARQNQGKLLGWECSEALTHYHEAHELWVKGKQSSNAKRREIHGEALRLYFDGTLKGDLGYLTQMYRQAPLKADFLQWMQAHLPRANREKVFLNAMVQQILDVDIEKLGDVPSITAENNDELKKLHDALDITHIKDYFPKFTHQALFWFASAVIRHTWYIWNHSNTWHDSDQNKNLDTFDYFQRDRHLFENKTQFIQLLITYRFVAQKIRRLELREERHFSHAEEDRNK